VTAAIDCGPFRQTEIQGRTWATAHVSQAPAMLFEFSGYVLQWSATEDIIISARCGWVLQVSCVRRFGSSKVGSSDQEYT